MVTAAATAHWLAGLAPGDVPAAPGTHRVVVDADLAHERRFSVLAPVAHGGVVRATPDVARTLGLVDGATVTSDALADAVAAARLALNGPDHVAYLPPDVAEGVRAAPLPPHVRVLTLDDADAFAAFTAACPPDDVDEAWVELDHWRVVGAFDGDVLVCAASAYPWTGTTIADLGALTAPTHRARGLARAVVRALAAQALAAGHEPQYRCQLDNTASLALSRAAGFERFATWDVVLPDDA